ncbi:MAG: hypothetical protein AAB425_07410 [Bdellovibrionota bacterium]
MRLLLAALAVVCQPGFAIANPLRMPERTPPTEEQRLAYEIPDLLRDRSNFFGSLTLSAETYGHTVFRDQGSTQGVGFALGPRLPVEQGALRPAFGLFLGKNLKTYAVLDAGFFYEDASTGNVAPYFGLASGISLENSFTTKSLMAGPAVGVRFKILKALFLNIALHVYWNAGITNQARLGLGINP